MTNDTHNETVNKELKMKGSFNNNRGFGVEIEYSRPRGVTNQQIANAIVNNGVTCHVENYNHVTRPHWKIVSDSSVSASNSNEVGRNELVSPILYGENGLKSIETVCEILEHFGCSVNVSCGVHVHHDVREQIRDAQSRNAEAYIEKMIKFVAKFEHCIYKLVSPSRVGGYYSTPVRKYFYVDGAPVHSLMSSDKNKNLEVKKEIKKAVSSKSMRRTQTMRACGLNLLHVFTRGSVEFRYHQGSINGSKIVNWVVTTQMILNAIENKRSIALKFVEGGKVGMSKFRKAVGIDNTEDARGKSANEWVKRTSTKFLRREADYRRQGSNYELVITGV